MNHAYFLTGTDTEIGKTFITCALLHRARRDGLRAAGLKPVAAGTDAAGLNEDVENIRAASSVDLPRALVNPYCFAPAVAPHIAAAEAGVVIDFAPIRAACAAARQEADVVIVEGVGGFCVPLGADQGSDDLAVDLGLPVIMVVTMLIQTKLNPTPPDPIQAKMMMLMPFIFGGMFLFFPSGLVLYWVVNNILTIAQQWYINKTIEKQRKNGVVVS